MWPAIPPNRPGSPPRSANPERARMDSIIWRVRMHDKNLDEKYAFWQFRDRILWSNMKFRLYYVDPCFIVICHWSFPLRIRPTQGLVHVLWSLPASCTWTQWIFSGVVGIVKPQMAWYEWSFMPAFNKNSFQVGMNLCFRVDSIDRWFCFQNVNHIAHWK
jgi:hypothetical protein